MNKYNTTGKPYKNLIRYSFAFKREIVEQIFNGNISIRYASKKYLVPRNTIASWCDQFSTEMNDKRISKNKEIKQLLEKIEDLEVVKYLQQDMLAQLMKDVGPERLEKSLPKPLFDEIRKLAKKLK